MGFFVWNLIAISDIIFCMKYRFGLYQAVGVALYCFLVGTFIHFAENIFGSSVSPILIIPIMLMILTFSVATVGTIIFGYPSYLFFNNKYKEAFTTVISTVVFGIIIISILLVTYSLSGLLY